MLGKLGNILSIYMHIYIYLFIYLFIHLYEDIYEIMFTTIKNLSINVNDFEGQIWPALPALTYYPQYLSIHYYLICNAMYITNIILVEDIHNCSNECYKF